LLKKIKQLVWNYHFLKEFDKLKRKRTLINLENAYKIGLIYNASEETSYIKVSQFVKFLQNKGKKVKALGFVKYKQIPHYCIPMLSFDFCTSKNINWFNKPSSVFVRDFINEEFDIIIDLNLDNNLSGQYISGLSKAKFKVGIFSESNSKYYDLMIKLDNKRNLNDYIKELIHYLTIINTNTDEKKI